ncbi:MAG TPA: hypothetical protein VLL30_06975, partial [Reyranella sp.]|nr:hypothetical protein [Reyranella sp.]
MRKVLRFAGQAVVIAAITLALDFTLTNLMFPGLKRALSVPNEANDNTYLPAPYDHDLAPDRIPRACGATSSIRGRPTGSASGRA